MSQFYTNIQLAGDTILYRGYQDGDPVQFRTKFSPTLYVPSKKKEKYKEKNLRISSGLVLVSIFNKTAFQVNYLAVGNRT